MPTPLVKVSKKFVINMGSYESYAPEFSIELPVRETYTADDVIHDNAYLEAFIRASELIDEAAYKDLTEAAEITNTKDAYILTWLHNRKEKPYARVHTS